MIAFSVLLCLVSSSPAQLAGTGLTGTVFDSSGRVMPGVQVSAVQDSTGLRRETLSSGQGTYDIPELPVGVYTVSFSQSGFETLSFKSVVQSLGKTRTLNATLKTAGTKEKLEVVAPAQSLDQTTDALGTDIERIQVEQLPLDGRDWATLSTLIPGAVDGAGGPGAGNQRSIRYVGRGRDDNNYTYDGIDATYVINQSQLYYVRLAIPLDTINEASVQPMLATAQTGETAGAQLILASPTGTNRFHGNAYEFLRNNIFDATDPIDALNRTHEPPFRLNQFGASFGGPIRHDKTFFFLAYEGYRQRLGQTLTGFVPSPDFSAAVLAQSPALAPVIDAYPIGQNPTSNPDVYQFVGQGKQFGQEDSGMFRLDHRFTPATNLFVRANLDEAHYLIPYSPSSGQYLNEQEELSSKPVNSVIALTHVFSPTLLNESKFGFNRGTTNTTYLNETGTLYAISVTGLTTLNNGRISTGVGNTFAGIDDFTWVKGKHVIKAGVEVRRVQMNQGGSAYGTVSFNSFSSFQGNAPYKASITGEYPVNGLRKTDIFAYIQDEFKVSPNFTMNLGLRYIRFGIFNEVLGRGNPFDFATCGPAGYCGVGASFGPSNNHDFDPRIAFAWSPEALHAKTVIRAGFGIYHEDGQLDDQNIPDKNEVLSFSLNPTNCPGLSYPLALGPDGNPACGVTGTNSPSAEQRDRKDTYSTQWGLSIQQELPSNFLATVAYVGSKGTHLLGESYVNVIDPLTGQRPYPAFSQVAWRGTVFDSQYEALSASLKHSFSRGLLVSANYTWAHEIDDDSNGSGDGDSITPQNVSCVPYGAPQCGERASGAFDARHVFNANVVYDLPFGPGKTFLNEPGVARTVLGSWSLSSIFVARTGFPVNITASTTGPDGNTSSQRPNLVPGQPLYLAGGAFNPAAFVPVPGEFGDVPRNFLRGPGAWQMDLGLSKRLPVTEQFQLQFRAEAFNIFNHALYALPDGLWGASDFGQIYLPLNTTPVGMGTPRQLQFMLKMSF
ncbi:MAG TPA: carboxypeptidase regulatory-like domain-containing protein [Terriglobales bacterium]|nr:carboxypeptidase regulatory-like domain-containing protein [Terriglobales bacterium]